MQDDEDKPQGTGKIDMEATERFTRTGRFRKIRPKTPHPTEMEDPTQKIIIFPIEESYRQEEKPPMYTAPLPKIQHLPPDFLFPEELEEHGEEEKEEEYYPDYAQEERKLSDLIKELEDKADKIAENLFAHEDETDWAEMERLERLIPGTDHEEGKRVAPSRQRVKVPKFRPPPEDIPPKELERKLERGEGFRFLRRIALCLLFLPAFAMSFLTLEFTGDFANLEESPQQILFLAYLLGFSMFFSLDILAKGLWRGFSLRVGMDTLGAFSGVFCLLDCFLQYHSENPRGQYPYVAIVMLHYIFLAYGEDMKRKAHATACSVASKVSRPYLISYEPHKWNNRPCYTKTSAPATGFSSQIQEEDGTQNFFALVYPLFLGGGFLLAWRLSRELEDFVWAISAFFVMACPLGAGFLYGRSAQKIAHRLKRDIYSALAGWPAVAHKANQCVVGDLDLFSLHYIKITGVTEFHGHKESKILAYTTALLVEGELGCSKLFSDMMHARRQKPPRVREVRYHDAGGITGKIGMDNVAVGGAAFTELMHIEIPEGMYVSQGIFCSVNGQVAGLFAVEYTLHQVVQHSLENLLYEKIRPILCTRDFALTPEFLRNRFKLSAGRMDFPSVLRRYDLTDSQRPENSILTAVVTRDGLEAVSDCVIGAKRLRSAVYWGLAVALTSTVLGFFLVSYLVASSAYNALSPDNLMFYQALWLVTFAIITDLPQRY